MTSRPNRRRGERGSASAELVIATPLLLLLLLGVVQFALWEHASHIAQAAAQQALDAARTQHASSTTGQAQARSVLDQLGRGVLIDPTVTVSRSTDTTRVQVHAGTEAVIPLLQLPVQAVATGPTEHFRVTEDQP
jgi:Flp pilus assembly protein TadG